MHRFISRLIVTLICFGCGDILSHADDPKTPHKVKLEFRRVELKPGEGFTEAIDPATSEKVYLHKKVELDNRDIDSASSEHMQYKEIDEYLITISFTKEGAKKMETLSKQLQGKKLALLFDGRVIQVPTIVAPLSSGAAILCKTKAEADKIVQALNSR